MLYSVLSKCFVGNYKKCRILRYVVSLPRISKAEASPTNTTESHFYAAFPELLDYFFPLCIWPSHHAVSWVWAANSEFSDLLVSGRLLLAEEMISGRPLLYPDSHTYAADPSCLYTASLCVPVLLVWGFFISVTCWDPTHYTSYWQCFVCSPKFRTELPTHAL
jgi:hypothetical protein